MSQYEQFERLLDQYMNPASEDEFYRTSSALRQLVRDLIIERDLARAPRPTLENVSVGAGVVRSADGSAAVTPELAKVIIAGFYHAVALAHHDRPAEEKSTRLIHAVLREVSPPRTTVGGIDPHSPVGAVLRVLSEIAGLQEHYAAITAAVPSVDPPAPF
jgi:hypothetical protein